MTPRLLLPLLIAALLGTSGCLFSKKSAKSKEDSAIAGDVDADFQRRWVDKRAAELVAGGTAAEAARAQALREFSAQYEYTSPGKNAKP